MAKLKIIKELLFFIVGMVVIRFVISKLFKTEFSFLYSAIIGIAAYSGYYFVAKKK
ncbi:hypothetical protein OCK72_06315 [Fusobacterium simiae]|uniref:ATP synthase I n=1 Tax=Fusobacterium simiae TaxID=855 RepID=A0ABT4DI39_FUSSI|nr:hypothetical protein [Fusobacterium simiae]MCY7008270.1 hypothetical protein [Fusobacterium simiae]